MRSQLFKSPSAETVSKFVELFIGACLLVVAYMQLYVHRRQATIMEMQTDLTNRQLAFQESVSRAWLRGDASINGPIIFTEWANNHFININVSGELKNTGSVPATDVHIFGTIEPFSGSDRQSRLTTIQSELCKSVKESYKAGAGIGQTVFPNDTNTIKTGFGSGGLYQTDNPGPLSIIVCIDYSYANDRHGLTSFRKILGLESQNKIEGIPFVVGQPDSNREPISPELLASGYPKDPPKIARVPADGLWFQEESEGQFAR